MKAFLYLLSPVVLAALGMFGSCELFPGNSEPDTELEKLPPITQEGKNTFGCLVNGKALVVKNTIQLTAIYQGGILQLGGGVEDESTDIDIVINLQDPLTTDITYDLTDFPSYIAKYSDQGGLVQCRYDFVDTFNGWIVLNHIDRMAYTVSGVFEFSTVTQECDTINITDGRFDMQYIP